ncbi:hypothetical protein ACLB2K_040927 [Fragaria x ananassa]
MGKTSGFEKEGKKKGKWSAGEDQILKDYVKNHGLGRCGKSVRLRWLNYLRPDIKHGNIREDEEDLIIRMHKLVGKRWSLIAGRIPGRTDNEIKNYWISTLSKKLAEEKRKKPEVPRNEIAKESLPSPIEVDDGHPHPTKCNEVPGGGGGGGLMCFASNVNVEEDHQHQRRDTDNSTTMSAGVGVRIRGVANNVQPTGDDLNDDAMPWNNWIMDLNEGQLDLSEFLQTDFSNFWEESDMVMNFGVGGCSTINYEWPNN